MGIDNAQAGLNIAIREILEKNVLTAEINDPFRSAIDLIVSQNSTYCLVMAVDEVQGIITYRDKLNLLGEKIEGDSNFYYWLARRPTGVRACKIKIHKSIKNTQNQNR